MALLGRSREPGTWPGGETRPHGVGGLWRYRWFVDERAIDTEALRRFEIDNQGQYGGGSQLEHHFGNCNWDQCIDGMNPLEVLALAREHAAVCDGSRAVPASRQAMSPEASATSVAITAAWGNVLASTLSGRPLLSAPGTGALDA